MKEPKNVTISAVDNGYVVRVDEYTANQSAFIATSFFGVLRALAEKCGTMDPTDSTTGAFGKPCPEVIHDVPTSRNTYNDPHST